MQKQVVPGDYNQLTLSERDRRWAHVRDEMANRGVDCLLVNGSAARYNEMQANVRYITNYADPLSTMTYALFPSSGDGTLVLQMMLKRSNQAQSWFHDIRPRATQRLPEIVAERLDELGLTGGTLGLAGMAFREDEQFGIPWNVYEEIRERLPNLRVVDVSDIFFDLRTIKTDEEVDCLVKSAALCDIAFKAHVEHTRIGMTEREVYAAMVHAADAAGAEPPTFLLMNSGPMPREALMGDPIPSGRILQRGDVIVSEISPKWAGYQAQGLQCLTLGDPTPEMQELAKYGAEIFHKVADFLRPGNALAEARHAGDDVIEKARAVLGGLADALHPLNSPAGMGGPDPVPRATEIQPNMAFMVEIGPGGNQPQHVHGGYCIITTDGAPRHLSNIPIEERLLTVVK